MPWREWLPFRFARRGSSGMILPAAPTAAQYDQTKLEEGPMSEAYVFYRHKAKPQYRLVLKEDAPFPSGTSPDQWVDQGPSLGGQCVRGNLCGGRASWLQALPTGCQF